MKIGLRAGHSPNCRGKVGIIDEHDSCKALYYAVKKLLEEQGHVIVDCNSNASTEGAELQEGTNKANTNNVDLYVALHMNGFNKEANGVECWCYDSNSSKAVNIGLEICKNISSLGLFNRGIKYNKKFHDLNATKAESIIVESLFCDTKHDTDLFNVDRFARAIANGIDNNINLEVNKEEEYDLENIVVYMNDIDKRAAEYLADCLVCPIMDGRRAPFDYSRIKNVYCVGGEKGQFTCYCTKHITGTNRYNTMQAVLNFIG